ncbi:MAG: cupin domain-containing protein [Deltaproteobacteria bacterium]|nr:cupin domain-containing protein [Deltaproteobacteria bacterium]
MNFKPLHTHDPQIDSIFIVSGQGEGYVNGDWRKIRAGDYLFVPPGVDHGIRNSGTGSLVLMVHHSPSLL